MMPICSVRSCLLMLSLLSSAGCSLFPERDQVLLNPSVPHRLAESCDAVVWARKPDGTLVQQPVRLEAGWWIASPAVLDATDAAAPHSNPIPLGTSP